MFLLVYLPVPFAHRLSVLFTRPHSHQWQQWVSDQLDSHLLLPVFQSNKQFGFIYFDSVLAYCYCFSHSCISTRVCDWQKCSSPIRLQAVCWESQVSLRIYVLHQITITDTILPASEFGNIRISPIVSPPPFLGKATLERTKISHRYRESCSHWAHGWWGQQQGSLGLDYRKNGFCQVTA